MLFQLCKDSTQAVGKLSPRPTQRPMVSKDPTAASTYPPTPRVAPEAPTGSPSGSSPSDIPTPLPTPTHFPPSWTVDTYYQSGALVADSGGSYYPCRPYSQSGWCGQEAYGPGNGGDWVQAWTLVGDCFGGTPSPTDAPSEVPTASLTRGPSPGSSEVPTATRSVWTRSDPPTAATLELAPLATDGLPTSAPTVDGLLTSVSAADGPPTLAPAGGGPAPVGDGEEEPYSGPLPAAFQNETYSTGDLDAVGVLGDDGTMAALLEATADVVGAGVENKFVPDCGNAWVAVPVRGGGWLGGLRGGERRLRVPFGDGEIQLGD